MKRMHRATRLMACMVWLACAPAVAQSPPAFEEPPRMRTGELLAPALLRSAEHRVHEDADLTDHQLEFVVDSDFGRYEVVSEALLEQRVHEIRVLSEAISQYEKANQELAAMLRGQLRFRGESVVEILASPIDTAADLAGQLSTNVYDTVTGTERPASPQPGPRPRAAARDSVFEAHKRAIAHQLNLDVYSTNPRVQDFLATVAEARASGTFSAGSGVVLRPARPVTRSVGKIDAQARSLIGRLDEDELLDAISGELRRIGVDWSVVQRFIANPWMPVSRKMMITAHLDFLSGVGGRPEIVALAAAAGSETEGLAHEQLVRMLAVYHEGSRLTRIIPGTPSAVARDGSVLILLPVDYLHWSSETAATFRRILARRAALGLAEAPVVLLVRGWVTERTRTALAATGIEVRQRFLHLDR